MNAAFVSVLPKNQLGDAALAELRYHGVDTSLIVRGGERLGIYFLETGSNQRPSVVIYDRSHSSMTEAELPQATANQIACHLWPMSLRA